MLIAMIAMTLINRNGLFATEGERLNVTPIQAAMLKYRKLARFATPADDIPAPPPAPTAPEPEPVSEPEKPRRKRTYRRRDMVSEP